MKYQTSGSAACDLTSTEEVVIPPNETRVVGTGVYLSQFGEVPIDICFFVLSRSGLAAKHSVFVIPAPGLIDRDYPSEIKVILHNAGRLPFSILPGDRIAQLFATNFCRIPGVEILSQTRLGGLGSTGV